MWSRLLCIALALSATSAQAAILTPGTWSPVAPPFEDGSAHWDHASWDGPGRNAGQILEGAWPGWESLSQAPWTAIDVASDVTLLAEISAYSGINQIGWLGGGAANYLFHGAAVPGATATWVTDRALTLWLLSPEGFWRSTDDPQEHTALFRRALGGGRYGYVVGWEDLDPERASGTDLDYNDALIAFEDELATIPEPSTLTLLGLGLVAAARRLRRRT